MKTVILVFTMFCLMCGLCNGQTYTDNSEKSYELWGSYISDFVYNAKGGIKSGSALMGKMDMGINFDFEKAKLWKGGSFTLIGQSTHGGKATAEYIGDLQVLSNIENADYTYLSECYYKQELGKLTAIVGLNNYNEFFNVSDYGLLFLNSSFGINPAVSLNMPVAIFPRNGLGALLGYQLNDRLNFNTAIYDGNPSDFDTDPYNTNWNWNTDEGIISAAEIQYASAENDELFFAYKTGFTYHNIDYVSFDNSSHDYPSNWTAYIIAEQQLYQSKINSKRKLGFFIQSGFAPPTQNTVDFYFGSGLLYYSVFTKKKSDQLGIAFAHCSMSKYLYQHDAALVKHETAVELTYQFEFNDNFYLQPGFHYIINPGADKRIEHASALSLRGMLKF